MPGSELGMSYGELTFSALLSEAAANKILPNKMQNLFLSNKNYIRFSYTNPTKRRAIGKAEKAAIPIIPKFLRIPLPAYQQANAINTDLELIGTRDNDRLTINVPKFNPGHDLVEMDLYALQNTVFITDPKSKAIGVFDVRYPKLIVVEQAHCPKTLTLKPVDVKINPYTSDEAFRNNQTLIQRTINGLRSGHNNGFDIKVDLSDFALCLGVEDDSA